jgi:hypothetical protein
MKIEEDVIETDNNKRGTILLTGVKDEQEEDVELY